ncbi:MAG: cytochrome c nitrite reductase small subunit [Desulfobacterales bacterium]|nr:cytochrome c nitrite reductase small subunit [Desulfobacterales bacterium]MBF0396874.1 cytochrome c nitrite reductase small subunit [Desulfobacterales bacterium]
MNIKKTFILLCVFILVITAAYIPYKIKQTSTPIYCSSCHVMSEEYESWFYSGKHKQIKCIDCHLPNDNFVNHYMWKGIDGMKDVIFFYTGVVPEIINASNHGKKTIQDNCIRCHEDMVININNDNVKCWECHRNKYHRIF